MKSLLLVVVVIAFIILATCSSSVAAESRRFIIPPVGEYEQTELDKYVQENDGHFKWRQIHENVKNVTDVISLSYYEMTSQFWSPSPNNSDHPLWKHMLVVIKPHNLNPKCETPFLYITWGKENDDDNWRPKGQNDVDLVLASDVAITSGCFAIILYQVPVQPTCLNFPDKTQICGSEDTLLAASFKQYLEFNMSARHLMLMPMVKAAIRAMDAAEQILPQKYFFTPKNFIVGGASKRGWTTWLVGAVDPKRHRRIKALLPIVLDGINFAAFLEKMHSAYNGWSWVFEPYVHAGLTSKLNTPIFASWAREIDPYSYRARLAYASKLAVDASDGEFQLTDSSRDWVHAMPGEMATALIRDADHPLIPNIGAALTAAAGWVQSVVYDRPRPSYSWSIDARTGEISLTTSEKPKRVEMFHVTVPGPRRDFRNTMLKSSLPPGALCLLKVMGGCARFVWWKSSPPTTIVNATSYRALLPAPPSGSFTGFYLWIEFASAVQGGADLHFSTGATILPLKFPFPGCNEANSPACNQTLV